MFPKPTILILLLAACALIPVDSRAQGEGYTIEMSSGDSMDLRHFSAPGSDDILLWFPCDQGMGTAEVDFADDLAKLGQEVWLADLLGMYFLPVAPSSRRLSRLAENTTSGL